MENTPFENEQINTDVAESITEETNETSAKLTNTKEVLVYIVEKFPHCFSLTGEAKPLKIKILDDLAEALKDDPKVSKTQLRYFLRAYTTNWRYLHAFREGAVRVDLNGNPCGVIEAEHVLFASQQLAEAKAAFTQKKKAQNAKQRAERSEKNENKKYKKNPKFVANQQNRKVRKNTPRFGQSLTLDAMLALTKGQSVKVKAGDTLKKATIIDVTKDNARVQLDNGLVITVTADRLFA